MFQIERKLAPTGPANTQQIEQVGTEKSLRKFGHYSADVSEIAKTSRDIPEELGGYPTFVPWDGYRPVFFGEYKEAEATPRSNSDEMTQVERATIGISKDDTGYWVIVQLERIKTTQANGKERYETNRQIIEIDTVHQSPNKLRLREKAPWISLRGERDFSFKANLKTGEASFRARYWNGGRLGSKPYSDKTKRLLITEIRNK